VNTLFPQTSHVQLLTFLSRLLGNAHDTWWWYDYGLSQPMCGLCGRTISQEMVGLVPAVYRLVITHEQKHVEQLGREKVEAAEALFLLRKDGDWNPILEDVWGGIPLTALPEEP
jgi:hypothetical protein